MYGLLLCPAKNFSVIIAYLDADWAGCPDSSRFTTGYDVFLGDKLISWRSKKQPMVSKSSTEAEYRVVAYTIPDTIWIKSILAGWVSSFASLFDYFVIMCLHPI